MWKKHFARAEYVLWRPKINISDQKAWKDGGWRKKDTFFLPFPSLHHCLKITQLLHIHSFYYPVSTAPFFLFCLVFFFPPPCPPPHVRTIESFMERRRVNTGTQLWVKKGDCWGRLSLRLDEVAVWPADKWERSWWTAWGPQVSILCDTEKLEASDQLLRTKLPFPANVCKFAFYRWVV